MSKLKKPLTEGNWRGRMFRQSDKRKPLRPPPKLSR